MFRKIRSALQTAALVVALPFSSAIAQQADEVTTPQVPEVKGRFTLVSADPETKTAIIKEAGRNFTFDCERLEHMQRRLKEDAITFFTPSLSLGSEHKRESSLKLRIALQVETPADAYKYARDIIKDDPHGEFKWAVQYADEIKTLSDATKNAGCDVPEGYKLTLINK